MTVEEYFGEWLGVIDRTELFKVVNQINKEYSTGRCYPDYKNIFKVFNITPYNKLVLVNIFQDPYNNGMATGIALGNRANSKSISPSLDIIRDAVIDYTNPDCNNRIFDITLEDWCKQGILMLNTALTVKYNSPLSHSKLWKEFTTKFLTTLDEKNPGLIYVFWGNDAKQFEGCIKHGIKFYERHPSYYARTKQKLDTRFFITLKDVVKRHFGRDIMFYKELINYESISIR